MNAASLIENFGHLANAPGGVSRIREMIYYLAVTARLSVQEERDGDAHTLLAQIEVERHRRIAEKCFKRSPKFENSSGTYDENLPDLPSSWTWTRLVDIGEISPRNVGDDEEMASFVSMSSISERHGVAVTPEARPWGKVKKGYTHFANGDVCVAKITPCFENGKAAVFEELPNKVGAGTTELHVVRVLPGVEPSYIYVFLRSPFFRSVGEKYMTGTAGQKRLPSEFFATRAFPLPPIEEQKRIVDKVDELMVLCDELEAQQQERERRFPVLSRATHTRFAEAPSIGNLDAIFDQIGDLSCEDMRRTILDMAVKGMFTSLDQNTKPAKELLADIRTQQIESRNTRKKVLGSGGQNEPELGITQRVPPGWAMATVSQVILEIQTGPFGSSLHKSDYTEGGTPVINPASLIDGGIVPIASMAVGEAVLERLSTFKMRTGDIVLARRGEMGRCAVVTEREDGWLCGTGSIVLRLPSSIHPPFLALCLGSPSSRSYLGGESVGATMRNLNQSILLRMPILLPPTTEQQFIVTKAQALMDLVDQLQTKQNRRNGIASKFAQSFTSHITGYTAHQNEIMKTPKSKLVSNIKMVKKPKVSDEAILANILEKQDGKLSAKSLWKRSGLEIDAFYQQLRTEIAAGWIAEPKSEEAFMKEFTTG